MDNRGKDERRCPVCGRSLAEKRSQARSCGGSCRAELSRLERLIQGRPADGMESIADWLKKRRLRRPLGPAGPNP